MFNTNRRHTEALEKSARALKRIAAAEETIARNLGAFLEDDDTPPATPPPLPPNIPTAPKTQSPKK
jgi:hypothetical protein